MWNLETLSGKTAVFRRTESESTPPHGDDWYTQDFNRRRTNIRSVELHDEGRLPSFADRMADQERLGYKVSRFFGRVTRTTSRHPVVRRLDRVLTRACSFVRGTVPMVALGGPPRSSPP